jgi:hypothetical protein
LFRVEGVVLPDTLYIVTASGGVETDNNLDGRLDNPGTTVLGQWRALMTGEQLAVAGNRVSILTESVLRAIEEEIPIRDDPGLLSLLDETADKLVDDTDSDGAVSYADLLHWSRGRDREALRGNLGDLGKIGVAVIRDLDAALLKILARRVLNEPAAVGLDQATAVRIAPDGSCEGRGRYIVTYQGLTISFSPAAPECAADDSGQLTASVSGASVSIALSEDGVPAQLDFGDGSVIQILECNDSRGTYSGRTGTNGPVVEYPLEGSCQELRDAFGKLGDGSLIELALPPTPAEGFHRLYGAANVRPGNAELFSNIAAESMVYGALTTSWAGCAAYKILLARESAGESANGANADWTVESCTSSLSEVAAWVDQRSPSEVRDFENSVQSVEPIGCPDCYSYVVSPEDDLRVGIGEVIDFTAVVPASAVLANWQFGDGRGIQAASTRTSYTVEGHYTAEFSAVYSDGSSALHTRNVTVQEGGCFQRPLADAGRNFEADTEAQVTLSGTGTVYSPPGCTLASVLWEQVGTGPTVVLTDPESVVVGFQVPLVVEETDLTFDFTVSDSDGATHVDTVTVTVLPEPLFCGRKPVANAGADRVVDARALVDLSGFGTVDTDPDCEIVSLEWEQLSGPEVFSGMFAAATVQFNAPEVGGDLVFELRVTDSEGQRDSDEVTITVRSATECADWLEEAAVEEEPPTVGHCEGATIRGLIPPAPQGCSGSYAPWVQVEGAAPSFPLSTTLETDEEGGVAVLGSFIAPNALLLDQDMVFEFIFAVEGAGQRTLEKTITVIAAPEIEFCELP